MKYEKVKEEIHNLEQQLDSMNYSGVHGSIVDRYITCGKDGCKCKKGIKHGPYPHIQVYDNKNKLHGIYIPKKHYERYVNLIDRNKQYIEIVKSLNKLYKKDRI